MGNFYSRPCGRGDCCGVAVFSTISFISTHAPAGGATYAERAIIEALFHFYSRPCGRGDHGLASAYVKLEISTHAPAGGATHRQHSDRTEVHNFYSRPCGRGDIVPSFSNSTRLQFLLTPLREGRLTSPLKSSIWRYISTHAPAGGATMWSSRLCACFAISTHAPAGGATRHSSLLNSGRAISTHAPAGGATYYLRRELARASISTHAPAGGATFVILNLLSWYLFLLTPLREGRRQQRNTRTARTDFYSRPCGRGDLPQHGRSCRRAYFYSRPCGRGDEKLGIKYYGRYMEFLLTPLREGRHIRVTVQRGDAHFYSRPCGRGDNIRVTVQRGDAISTHAPAGGATRRSRPRRCRMPYFYSRPCGRGDRPASSWISCRNLFLLTPLREGRRAVGVLDILRPSISTHAPAGGATVWNSPSACST